MFIINNKNNKIKTIHLQLTSNAETVLAKIFQRSSSKFESLCSVNIYFSTVAPSVSRLWPCQCFPIKH